ncbi:hypothetical protein AVEN_105695-1 [Araneus ventricosus]|uniref:Uncharacterized protein n=1 Tax=Araneus ventricosus TaxID=182803 RepID=A0A4Y2W859_ARAVE|nr:hypothetical protein AVEN_105695-1 [Araneus ventricosus]
MEGNNYGHQPRRQHPLKFVMTALPDWLQPSFCPRPSGAASPIYPAHLKRQAQSKPVDVVKRCNALQAMATETAGMRKIVNRLARLSLKAENDSPPQIKDLDSWILSKQTQTRELDL